MMDGRGEHRTEQGRSQHVSHGSHAGHGKRPTVVLHVGGLYRGSEKAVVAIAKAASDAYPDPADKTGKLHAVDVVPAGKLKRPVTLAEIKADQAFAGFDLVRISRLSVMPVAEKLWARIEALARK